jgi:acetolactate synthase I/III small subunit
VKLNKNDYCMNEDKKDTTLYTIIVFSENLAGVLNLVTNVFTRRQLNIESLNVSASGIEHVHRYTITCYTDEHTVQTLVKQLEKKIDVIQAQYFTNDEIYVMDQALYKIATARLIENRNISKAIRQYDGKIVEVNSTYAIVSKEGLPEETLELYHKLSMSEHRMSELELMRTMRNLASWPLMPTLSNEMLGSVMGIS